MIQSSEKTRELLTEHYHRYPKLEAEDIFKYLFQSAFGCEHLVAGEAEVLHLIKREYQSLPKELPPVTETLDGDYSRVFLSHINGGLKAETLAKLFSLSAKKEPNGRAFLEQKICVARELVANGKIPLDIAELDAKIFQWKSIGFPAVRHSEVFRSEYQPSYRVISNRYAELLQVFSKIDVLLDRGNAVICIEGGSASGKTTLAQILNEVYDCNVFHTDDFFLRPEQRTVQRLAEVGGNLDRERFLDEVVKPLRKSKPVRYRPFDCSSQSLGEPITVTPKKLTVVEGVYSMHPAFDEYYNLSVFLDISSERQRARILKRNATSLANRFFEEWIPLEKEYFSKMRVKERCSLSI